jgi:hypothetical protein
MPTPRTNRLLTPQEVAALRRCTCETVRNWIKRGVRAADGTLVRLSADRIGSRYLIREKALRRFRRALRLAIPATQEFSRQPSQEQYEAEQAELARLLGKKPA